MSKPYAAVYLRPGSGGGMSDAKLVDLIRDLNHPDRVAGRDRARIQFLAHAELVRRGGHWDWMGIRYTAAPDGSVRRVLPFG